MVPRWRRVPAYGASPLAAVVQVEGASGFQSPWGMSPRAVLEGISIEGLGLVNVFVRSFHLNARKESHI